MERVVAELEWGVETLRNEWRAAAVGQRGEREFHLRISSLQQTLAAGTRRRYLALATQLDLAGRGVMRDLVYRWAMDDELQQAFAESESWRTEQEPLETALDAKLWGAYFDAIVVARPWAALGAAAVWEAMSGVGATLGRERRLAGATASAGRSASHFSELADREEPTRADELVAALQSAEWDDEELSELIEGAAAGRLMGLRMVRWSLGCGDQESEGLSGRFSHWEARLG
jgi:hypothetical protein